MTGKSYNSSSSGVLAKCALPILALSWVAQAGAVELVAQPTFKAGELLVKRKASASQASFDLALSQAGALEIKRLGVNNKSKSKPSVVDQWVKLRVGRNADLKQIRQRLEINAAVEVAEFNYLVRAVLAPDDTSYGQMWGLDNTGQTGGLPDADIDAPEAWDLATGNATTLVAVIDTGVDYTHPDLAANIWVNPGEIVGNGIDDDGNGFVDDVHGYDFANHDSDPFDDHGHGTHVAGTIAAQGNNGLGVVGVNWQAKVMALKFLNASGEGYTDDAVNAVAYATTQGAKVMNNSWGGDGYSQALFDAISESNSAGALFVAAAGNAAANNDVVSFYPANYEVPNVVAVAATDHYDNLAWFSNYGATKVHLGAPGVDILSTVPASGASCCSSYTGYARLNGTSMATPHVSGAAALMWVQDPSRTGSVIKGLLISGVDPVPGLAGRTVANGRMNVYSSMTCDGTTMQLRIEQPSEGFTRFVGEPELLQARVLNCGAPITGATVSVAVGTDGTEISLFDDGTHGDAVSGDGRYANNWTPVATGARTLTFNVSHAGYRNETAAVSGSVSERITYEVHDRPFNWIDVAGGTPIPMGDDSAALVPIGFDFSYYGTLWSELYVGSNGLLSFGAPVQSYTNTPLPQGDGVDRLIAPFWDDLNPSAGGMIYTLLDGVAPNRRLTVAWLAVPFYGDVGSVNAQVTLYEGSNEIVYQYRDVVADTRATGISATIGIEDDFGLEGTQYGYNEAVLVGNKAIAFVPTSGSVVAPIADAGSSYVGNVTGDVQFDGSASSASGGRTLSYAWDFGDGSTGTGVTPAHRYTAVGTYTVTLIVNDGISDSLPASATVTIVNLAPVANAGPDFTIRKSVTPSFTLDGSGSYDFEGPLRKYRWHQVSGPAVTIANSQQAVAGVTLPVKFGPLPVKLKFRLTVTDAHGAVRSDAVVVTVRR